MYGLTHIYIYIYILIYCIHNTLVQSCTDTWLVTNWGHAECHVAFLRRGNNNHCHDVVIFLCVCVWWIRAPILCIPRLHGGLLVLLQTLIPPTEEHHFAEARQGFLTRRTWGGHRRVVCYKEVLLKVLMFIRLPSNLHNIDKRQATRRSTCPSWKLTRSLPGFSCFREFWVRIIRSGR